MNIKFFIVLLILFFTALSQSSAQEIYLGNKLRSITEQINDLRIECKYREDQDACTQEMNRLKKSRTQLYHLCKENPEDPLCVQFPGKKEKVDDLRILCMNRPFEKKCQKQRDQIKRKQKSCEKNPLASGCQSNLMPQKPKNYNDLVEHCNINPKSKYCLKLNQTDSDKKKQEQSQKGLSTF